MGPDPTLPGDLPADVPPRREYGAWISALNRALSEMNASATGTAKKRWLLIKLLKSRPITAAGMNAISRFIKKRCDARSLNAPAATPRKRRRYSHTTAIIAPV